MRSLPRPARPLRWIGSSFGDYRKFPEKVQDVLGYELFLAQTGQHPPSAKPLKGFAPGTVELIEDHDGDTNRAVYTMRFESALYVLHAFKKKTKRGVATPQSDVELIRRRLRDAETYAANRSGKASKT